MGIGDRKTELRMKALADFYNGSRDAAQALRDFANRRTQVSCRMIEWFVSAHCRRTGLVIYADGQGRSSDAPRPGFDARVDVFNDYRATLKGMTKAYFDPFRRNRNSGVTYAPPWGDPIETTLGQMGFVRWAFTRGVLDYVSRHSSELVGEFRGNGSAAVHERPLDRLVYR